ncbi:MAG: tRNA pseudouridine(38-40) synthase TruA [Planctomycetota bacterium]
MRFAAIVEYDGTGFNGWQVQPNAPTVQLEVEKALSQLYGESIRVVASGRTDTGVHARGQVIHFDAPERYPPKTIRSAINHFLDERVSLVYVKEVEESFHARFSARRKKYLYRLISAETRPAIGRQYVHFTSEPLDLAAMREAARLFVGEVDFRPFASEPDRGASCIRLMHSAEVILVGNHEYDFSFVASGFLYNLVRSLVGTLLAVGRGRMTAADVGRIICEGDRSEVPPLAPPQGLSLQWVEYDGHPDLQRKEVE